MEISIYYIVIIPVIIAYTVRKNWLLFILFSLIAYFNFSICSVDYWFIIDCGYSIYAKDHIANIGLNVLLLFIIVIIIFVPFNLLRSIVIINSISMYRARFQAGSGQYTCQSSAALRNLETRTGLSK